MKKVVLIDFDDSFSHNLVSLISNLGLNVTLVHWRLFSHSLVNKFDLTVLGPGPGHPSEYRELSCQLPNLSNKKLLGVCLGHQLLLQSIGGELVQLDNPLHGQSLLIPELTQYFALPDFRAQFYNSWYINSSGLDRDINYLKLEEMIVYFQWHNWAGTQFHPESVGTSCPEGFLSRVLENLSV